MSLEELLKSRIIRKMKPNSRLAVNSLMRARRDIDTARTLIKSKRLDWSLALSYNAMLLAGRALMFSQGYRPSSIEGHAAVVKYLHASVGTELSAKMIMVQRHEKEEAQDSIRRDGHSFRRRGWASAQMG